MVYDQKILSWRKEFILAACLLLTTMLLTSCAMFLPHDAITHKNLIELKAQAVQLVETFDAKPFDSNEAAITDLAAKFRKAHVYEKEKEKRNRDLVKQLDRIWRMLIEDMAMYRENGSAPRGPQYFHEAAIVLGKAFDDALAAE